MKNYIFITGSIFLSTQAFAIMQPIDSEEGAKVTTCSIKFDFSKATFSKAALEKCINEIDGKEYLRYVNISTFASYTGNSKYNLMLTDRRAQALTEYIHRKFPNVSIKRTSVGRNDHYGRTGSIRFVAVSDVKLQALLVEAEKEKLMIEERMEGELSKKMKTVASTSPLEGDRRPTALFGFRASIRNGLDSYLRENQTEYYSQGFDLNLVYHAKETTRYEAGVQGSQLVRNGFENMFNYYGTASVYYVSNISNNSNFILGLRGLLGGVHNQAASTGFDYGGEARIGFEYHAFSVNLGIGRTHDFVRVGLEVGLSI